MNTIVFNKLSSQVLFEEKANEVERSSRNYLEVIDGQHPDLLASSTVIKDSSAIRHRRSGSRQNPGKVRHKRQALQDMARPLKQWLYKHRDNPYPTKTEKILLALGSQMTLVQVSNWFANARRRLKNTVRQPDLSWALRIKLYNKYVQGNAERLSVSSHDSCSDDGDPPARAQVGEFSKPMYQSVIKKEGGAVGAGLRAAADASLSDDYVSPPKYKSSLLHRYLNDSLRHVMVANGVMDARRRNHSGSFSSNEYDEDLLSPSSSEAEANFIYRTARQSNPQPRKCQHPRRSLIHHRLMCCDSKAEKRKSNSVQTDVFFTRESFKIIRENVLCEESLPLFIPLLGLMPLPTTLTPKQRISWIFIVQRLLINVNGMERMEERSQ
ncbi:homeobox protein Mohawk isoform X1 [Cyprinus carpio]|uniref:Homeobox protein Mohawk isoform X1 n=2 Tax=Cyprinus carpio TaxID=7962 RepID=A0A9Q9YPV5_CYPCA|nr:homeobox protein Mohawk isoform X1 [Cyprinus carpio]XP_042623530.1 homeobox protein Mohawk isoform X1 [Cyprinus carpio]XP_042623531.1 homeobox protein Mohawk isoform X1 [Cyprinus carpio]